MNYDRRHALRESEQKHAVEGARFRVWVAAQALENEQNLKQDSVADTRKTTFSINEHGPTLEVDNIGSFDVTMHAARPSVATTT